jgi:integrase
VGRVAYLSANACEALTAWVQQRDQAKERLFYGQGRPRLSYTAARLRFARYLDEAGLAQKGYSLHYLRHTCATVSLEDCDMLTSSLGLTGFLLPNGCPAS